MCATRKVILDPRTTDLYYIMSTNLGMAQIVVQLPEDDRKLLLNGRPWQFLELGPDENDLGVELMSIESTVAELSDVSERVDHAAWEIDLLKKELLRRKNRLVLLQSQQYGLSGPMNPFPTNPTIGTAIKSTDWQDATKQSKNMQLPNGSSSQHAQSLSDTYGSPQNAARRLKVIDLMSISSTQHAQSTPYVTATGPSTQPVSHTPSSACTSNTDAMYSPTETEEQLVRHVGYPGANLPDADLSIEDIVVQLPEDDRKLLLTGRPWQFLEPGPDENDLAKEIDSIEITVAELSAVSERVTKG
ncbi:hypothetical protein KXV52_001749 [Aspergillus fumigatus]|nr:hypothetical protein KXV73_003717 [Aspergillus fumigatus]KAH3370446.1 hypothetical protein KXV52_001749 [Aspergillus fumigatus]